MKLEIRADGSAFLSGYVNAVERQSRPVLTPRGKVIEIVKEKVFERALGRAGIVPMTIDHNPNRVVTDTAHGLKLYEDNIGLRAEAEITDTEVIAKGRQGKIKGWSFGMTNIVDEIEERADDLPLRKINSLDLDHVTLVIEQTPCYSATSVELRAEGEELEVETRTEVAEVEIEEKQPEQPEQTEQPEQPEEEQKAEVEEQPEETVNKVDYSMLNARIRAL